MPTPPSTSNYQVGGATVILGGIDLGNIVSLEIDPSDVTVLQHFTARSGARKVDKQVIVQKRLVFRAELDEHAVQTYRKYFMAGGAGQAVQALTQPLAESNIVVQYVNETGNIWTFSHTRATSRPSGSMDFGEFSDWVSFEVEIEVLQDDAAAPAIHGTFTFT